MSQLEGDNMRILGTRLAGSPGGDLGASQELQPPEYRPVPSRYRSSNTIYFLRLPCNVQYHQCAILKLNIREWHAPRFARLAGHTATKLRKARNVSEGRGFWTI